MSNRRLRRHGTLGLAVRAFLLGVSLTVFAAAIFGNDLADDLAVLTALVALVALFIERLFSA